MVVQTGNVPPGSKSSAWSVADRWPFPISADPKPRWSRRKLVLLIGGSVLVLSIAAGYVRQRWPVGKETAVPIAPAVARSNGQHVEVPRSRSEQHAAPGKEATRISPGLEPASHPEMSWYPRISRSSFPLLSRNLDDAIGPARP